MRLLLLWHVFAYGPKTGPGFTFSFLSSHGLRRNMFENPRRGRWRSLEVAHVHDLALRTPHLNLHTYLMLRSKWGWSREQESSLKVAHVFDLTLSAMHSSFELAHVLDVPFYMGWGGEQEGSRNWRYNMNPELFPGHQFGSWSAHSHGIVWFLLEVLYKDD